jgi:hypothetical protein
VPTERRETPVPQVWTFQGCRVTEGAPVSPGPRDPQDPPEAPEARDVTDSPDCQVLKETWVQWEPQDPLEALDLLADLASQDLKVTTVSPADQAAPVAQAAKVKGETPVSRDPQDPASLPHP